MARRAPAGAGPPFGPLSTLQLASPQVAASPCGPSASSPTTHKHTGSKQPPAAHRCTRPPAPRMRAFSSGWLGLWSRVSGMARRPRGSCRAGGLTVKAGKHCAGTARQVICYWQAGCHTVAELMLPQNQLRLSGPAEKGAWRTWRASTALLSPTHAVVSRRPCRQASQPGEQGSWGGWGPAASNSHAPMPCHAATVCKPAPSPAPAACTPPRCCRCSWHSRPARAAHRHPAAGMLRQALPLRWAPLLSRRCRCCCSCAVCGPLPCWGWPTAAVAQWRSGRCC